MVQKGARTALGFRRATHSPGAEVWAGRFWRYLADGQSVEQARRQAAIGLLMYGVRDSVVEGDAALTIHPARYNTQP